MPCPRLVSRRKPLAMLSSLWLKSCRSEKWGLPPIRAPIMALETRDSA